MTVSPNGEFVNVVRRSLVFALVVSLTSACSGGGGNGGHYTPVGPSTSPSPGPTSTGVAPESAYQCPTSDAVASSSRSGASVARHMRSAGRRSASAAASGRLAVTYDLATLASSRTSLVARETSAGATLIKEYDFPHASLVTRVLSVAPAQQAAIAATLRQHAGVKSVAATGGARYPQTITTPYFPNDPYFTGFASPPPATFEVGPYEENPVVPGQWNMHAIGLEDAFAYSQSNNGSGITNANALGSSSIKLAVIDTGQDTTHPELASKITYQKCFITDTNNVQSTSNFTTDQDGHGTDVAGIAAAATGNDFGFTGAGGNTSLYGYRVEPMPDDNCASPTTTDPQCLVSTNDIASAILDAVAQKVNVISLSLGGDQCSNGVDPDPVEGNAIAEALAANIVVVASAGNDGAPPLEAPACDTGVIAAGASALGDGTQNGTNSVGSVSAPVEYVASYSDTGSPASLPKNASAWGIVAPGGDPSSDNDSDYLHWVYDIWTTTPLDITNFGGDCSPDYPGTGTQPDCRTLIAGTSMSAPTVAGAVALVIAANPAYQSPTKMKSLLCGTADDIGDPNEGCGRLNVYRAMATAVGDPKLP